MVVNRYFGGVLGGVGNNLNTVIMYLFLYAGMSDVSRRTRVRVPRD